MTKEEAINVFKGFKFLPREQKAVDMAIEALKQKPCPDAVSRQEIMKAFAELPHEYKNSEQRARTGGIAACQVIAEQAPSVALARPTCKDCKWKSRDIDFRNLKCPWGERVEMTDDDFCSRYERR